MLLRPAFTSTKDVAPAASVRSLCILKTLTSPKTLEFRVHQLREESFPLRPAQLSSALANSNCCFPKKTKPEFHGYTRATRAAVAACSIPEI